MKRMSNISFPLLLGGVWDGLRVIYILAMIAILGITAQAAVPTVTWDKYSLIIDAHRVCPVMGEVHYSRIPADEWADEVRKIKEGGVTVIATYVFWNHIEEQEGIFNWSGQRDLRRFLEICKEQEMPVILRIGPGDNVLTLVSQTERAAALGKAGETATTASPA